MQTEIEAKFLNIDHDEIRNKLESIGAKCVNTQRMMKRKNYDYPDRRLEKEKTGWIRVRDEGDITTLAYKQLNDRTLHGTKEISIDVGSFDDACRLLEEIGLVRKSYHETRRESWRIDDVEIELDEWPWVPPFIEVEAPSEGALLDTLEKLDLNLDNAEHGSVEVVYQAVYNVTEEEVDSWDTITFGLVPDWLEERRK